VGRGPADKPNDLLKAYMRLDNGQYIWKEEGFDLPVQGITSPK
jgi:hypothetical protein